MPAARSTTLRSTLLAEISTFARNSAEIPYDDLARHFDEAGWCWYLRESGTTPMPDATVLVHFEVLLGRSMDALEAIDSMTIRMVAMPGPLSMAARAQAVQTLLYMIYGRLPPMPVPAAGRPNGHAGEQVIDMSGGNNVVLPGEQAPRLDDDKDPNVLNLVDRLEPDGLPILRDPYDIGQPEVGSTREVVEALLRTVAEYLPRLTSIEQVKALGVRNPEIITFLKDFGTDDDSQQMRTMIEARRRELSVPPPATAAPRRRSAAEH